MPKDWVRTIKRVLAIPAAIAGIVFVSAACARQPAAELHPLLPAAQNLQSAATSTSISPPGRAWAHYTSSRLGFSIDYPSDSFTPEDGLATGESNSVSFADNDETSQRLAQNIGSDYSVEVTPVSLPYGDGLAVGIPKATTTLAGLPAFMQYTGNASCPNCQVRFAVNAGSVWYTIIINNSPGLAPPDFLSDTDIEHIRQSFVLIQTRSH